MFAMFEEITNVSVLSDKKSYLFCQNQGEIDDCPPFGSYGPALLLSLREISHKNRRNTVLEKLDHPQAEQQLR